MRKGYTVLTCPKRNKSLIIDVYTFIHPKIESVKVSLLHCKLSSELVEIGRILWRPVPLLIMLDR
ncbi:hypothetical protein TUM4644_01320 [Shewanella colwelliana]|nr:hypothetical protein TUM4644_01320 [Shewanella colwelliana]